MSVPRRFLSLPAAAEAPGVAAPASGVIRRVGRAVAGSLVVMVLLALAVGQAGAVPAAKRVAVLTPPDKNPYIGAWNAAFRAAAEAHGLKVVAFVTPFDGALQARQVDEAVAKKVDAIAIDAIDHKAVLPALKRAKAAGVPVFDVIAPLDDTARPLVTSFIGPDDEALGRLAAQNLIAGLAEEKKKSARVVAVTGFATEYNVERRMAGFRSALAHHPGIRLVAQADGRWSTALSEKAMAGLLAQQKADGGIDAVYAMADNMAAGVIRAIEAAGLDAGSKGGGIVVVSSGCMKDGIQNIRAGKELGTDAEIPAHDARLAADTIATYLAGGKVARFTYVQSHSIDRADLDDYARLCSY